MNRKTTLSLLLSVGLVTSSNAVLSENKSNTTEKKPAKEQPLQQVVNEKAIALEAMSMMSEHLRGLDKYTVNANISFDEVLDSGQKLFLTKQVEIRAEHPTNLWVKTSMMNRVQRQFYFDGQTFTVYTPNLGLYASFDAPVTIGKVVTEARKKYDIELPIADLFLWGADSESSVDEAMIIGVDKVDGVSCNHFAFREKNVDWQVCIQRGGEPLPLKLIINDKSVKNQTKYVAIIKWDTAPSLDGQSYTFTPKEGEHKINFKQNAKKPVKVSQPTNVNK